MCAPPHTSLPRGRDIQLVELFRTKQKGWPIALKDFPPAHSDEAPASTQGEEPPQPAGDAETAAEDATTTNTSEDAVEAPATTSPAVETDEGEDANNDAAGETEATSAPSVEAEAEDAVANSNANANLDTMSISSVDALALCEDPGWLHRDADDETSLQLLQEAGLRNGQFLVRVGDGVDTFVLDLVVHGQVTHHLIKQDIASGLTTVNGEPLGGSATLVELIDWMCEVQETWPMVLISFVPNARVVGGPEPYAMSVKLQHELR